MDGVEKDDNPESEECREEGIKQEDTLEGMDWMNHRNILEENFRLLYHMCRSEHELHH